MVIRRKKAKRSKSRKKAGLRDNPKNVQLHIKTMQRLSTELKLAWAAFRKDIANNDVKKGLKDGAKLRLLLSECKFIANKYRQLLPARRKAAKKRARR